MRWRQLARTLVDAYNRTIGKPVDFWTAFSDEVREAVMTEQQTQAAVDEQRSAAMAQHRRDHPADAPSDQTRPVPATRPGLGRGVTYVGRVTPPAAPADPTASIAPRAAAASR